MRSSDYTRLKQRENKLWEFGGIAIPGGLSTVRAAVAGVGFIVLVGFGGLLAQLTDNVWLGVGGLVVGMVAALIGYAVAGRESPDRMTLGQRTAVLFDYLFAQPRRISGFSRDAEPDHIHWRAIVWEPTSPEWVETHNTFARHLIRRWFATEGGQERP
ncbi:hypothetical protein GCM10027418_07830 [Mariniluteicoccus endophyticus]